MFSNNNQINLFLYLCCLGQNFLQKWKTKILLEIVVLSIHNKAYWHISKKKPNLGSIFTFVLSCFIMFTISNLLYQLNSTKRKRKREKRLPEVNLLKA